MKKDSRKYNIYHGVMAGGRWVLFAIVSFIILFPVYWIFISSITPSGELFKTPIDYLPDHPTLESYKFLIENVGLLSKVGNTVLIVGLTLVISTVFCAMAAYGFSRFTTKGINIAFAFIIATMLIPEVVTARPLYEFMQKVKLYDSTKKKVLAQTTSDGDLEYGRLAKTGETFYIQLPAKIDKIIITSGVIKDEFGSMKASDTYYESGTGAATYHKDLR